ncbi:AMP-binding protein [Aquihabitans sp. G128]|uniref:AMP-binding protein n=1 Tax=Aquihabitans sp. G128 TaxID=2849779 RepID=UPI001C21AF60|nr:AMP-binding protein [Aquihabitans sp. G128]QXC62128.1 AMP-binding protein [Aquihabitans sp. G128]
MGSDGASPLPAAATSLVVDERRAWSADEVWDVADRIAHLTRAATGDGDLRMAVFAENAAESVIAHVGGLRSGSSVVPVNSHLSATEAAYLLRVADVSLVVAGPGTAERARAAAAEVGHCEVHVWDETGWDDWLASAPAGPPADDRPIPPNLLFTSGTTGTPKATELPPNVFPRRRSWAGFVEALAANRFVGRGRHLVVAPLHHTGPLNAVRALAVGTPIGVLDRFDARRTLDAIRAWEIGSTTLVPTHLSRLAALPADVRSAADTSTLQLVFQTGASCPVDVKRAMIEWWGPVLLEAYGATEVGVTSAITSQDWLEHPGSVGRAVPPYTAVVVDDAGDEVEPGVEGRLCFRDATGRGIVYHDDPERTAAAHVAPGVFTLGEIGKVDADGFVYVTDRFADMVVTGGVNVYPAEMEQVLIAHPAVADVAGIGVAHPDLGEQLVALVVPEDPAAPPSPEALQAWCEERLSRFKCPRQVRLVATLDRNPLGKLDKKGLRVQHG